MTIRKRLLRNGALRGAFPALAALYIRVVHATGDWRVSGGETPESYWRADRPFILAFWHGRLMMMPYCWPRGRAMNMLISRHPDGRIVARVIARFGLASVEGSSGGDGSAALRAALRALARGECVGITPDGPRGPRMRASAGVVELARLSGAPVLPAAFAASRRRLLESWDRFVVPLPFSRGVFVWGAPVEVARDADAAAREAARRAVEDGLNAVTAEADCRVGQSAIEPAAEAVATGATPPS
ncbi:MAG: lysophospholipid acyltransferase family protein [Alphaproteobacteria bacterium]